MKPKKEFYSNLELVEIAAYCNSESELLEASMTLQWLWALGEKINLELFRKLAKRRWHTIYEKK